MFKRKKQGLLLLIVILAMVFTLAACSNHTSSDIPEAWELFIETPEGEMVTITQADGQAIGMVDLQATSKYKDGTQEENTWTGMILRNVLDFADIGDYHLVELEAADGFTVEYTPEIVNSDGTILALKVDGEMLDEDSGPIQSVVQDQGQNLWIRQVVKVKVSH